MPERRRAGWSWPAGVHFLLQKADDFETKSTAEVFWNLSDKARPAKELQAPTTPRSLRVFEESLENSVRRLVCRGKRLVFAAPEGSSVACVLVGFLVF